MDDATPAQARELFIRFYGGEATEVEDATTVERLGATLEDIVKSEMDGGTRLSMAALQGLFIRSNVGDAIDGCRALFDAKRIRP